MYTEFAQGRYSIKEMSNITYSWGMKSKSGKPLVPSAIHRILTNPFYIGVMVFNDKKYKGNHMKAINTGTYLQVAKVIKGRSKPAGEKKDADFFPFTGLLTCSECGCSITAEMQKGHKYYRCTKKKGKCSQKYVREEVLQKKLDKILKQISIDKETFSLMLQAQKLGHKEEHDNYIENLDFWQNEDKKVEEKKRRLLDLVTDGKISEEEYEEKKNELVFRQTEIEENMEELKKAGNSWIEQQKDLAIACHMAFLVFEKGNNYDKKLILHTVGSNFSLEGENVHWDWLEPFDMMVKNRGMFVKRGGRDSNPQPSQ